MSSLKKGWLDDYDWFKTPVQEPHTKNDYVIYSYEDRVNKAVYVGLTMNIKRRHSGHRSKKDGKYDTVAQYFQSIGQELPNPVVKMEGLSSQEAQYYENWYVEGYKRAGWTVINSGKTGENTSSLGGTYVKWTYDKCKEEAGRYKTRGEFKKNSCSAYGAALKYGWLDDFFVKSNCKSRGYWTYERCYNEASKYKIAQDFRKCCKTAYRVSTENGWSKDYTWFIETKKPIGYWNYEHCYETAKGCESMVEFREKYGSAYNVSKKNKWLKDYTWFVPHKKKNGYWTYERCYEEAKKYKTRNSFDEGNAAACSVARKNKWLDDYYWFLSKSETRSITNRNRKKKEVA